MPSTMGQPDQLTEIMHKFTSIFLTLFITLSLDAQRVSFVVSDGIDNGPAKTAIQTGLSTLLTRMGEAAAQGSAIDYSSIKISDDAKTSINMLWSNVPFCCCEEEVVEIVISSPDGGYQVRNIPLELQFEDGSQEDSYQEAVVDFAPDGSITSFYFALSANLYRQVIGKGSEVGDLRRRQMILDYVEHFRTAYNQKDIDFLDQVFSDDALIITGKVVKTVKNDMNTFASDKIVYNTYNKQQYITRLKNVVFPNAKYIKVTFSEIKVKRHPAKKDYYGVLLRQGYDSGHYQDDGYLFLLWDFRDESHPQIHVRTWQPYYIDEANSVVIDESEIFDVSSFDL